MITVLGLNRQNRTTGISEIALDMRNMPKSDASGTKRTKQAGGLMSVRGGGPEMSVARSNRPE
jgi:hypothetical protein